MKPDTCICGYPVPWHFDRNGRYLPCTEVKILVTGKVPKFPSCDAAMKEVVK